MFGHTSRRGKEPLPPRSGRSKRKQIQNACTSCRERKSKVIITITGSYTQAELTILTVLRHTVPLLPSFPYMRYKCPDDSFDSPTCSTCQGFEKECEYKTEEGESRWAALNRKNNILEAERDEAHELLSSIRSLPESEAQVIFHRIRLSADSMDLGSSIQQIRGGVDSRVSTEQGEQHSQHRLSHVRERSHTTSPIISLPPLRSVVEVPRVEPAALQADYRDVRTVLGAPPSQPSLPVVYISFTLRCLDKSYPCTLETAWA